MRILRRMSGVKTKLWTHFGASALPRYRQDAPNQGSRFMEPSEGVQSEGIREMEAVHSNGPNERAGAKDVRT